MSTIMSTVVSPGKIQVWLIVLSPERALLTNSHYIEVSPQHTVANIKLIAGQTFSNILGGADLSMLSILRPKTPLAPSTMLDLKQKVSKLRSVDLEELLGSLFISELGLQERELLIIQFDHPDAGKHYLSDTIPSLKFHFCSGTSLAQTRRVPQSHHARGPKRRLL